MSFCLDQRLFYPVEVWLTCQCRLLGMITGAAGSTVYYNLKLRHPTLDMPIIDYNLALLMQPMLMLGISIGVVFNVVFPDWLVTVLLITLFMCKPFVELNSFI